MSIDDICLSVIAFVKGFREIVVKIMISNMYIYDFSTYECNFDCTICCRTVISQIMLHYQIEMP